MIVTVAGTLLWNLCSLPLLLALPGKLAKVNTPALLLILMFPLIGVALIIPAVHAFLRWRRYGRSILVMSTMPASIGGTLSATLEIPARIETTQGMEIILSCIREETQGSGKNRRTTENIIWQDRRQLRHEQISALGRQTRVSFVFDIPDATETSREATANTILWRLEVQAETSGVDYAAAFEVPVFNTGVGLMATTQKMGL